jgi:hypothetical protein
MKITNYKSQITNKFQITNYKPFFRNAVQMIIMGYKVSRQSAIKGKLQ